MATVNQKAQFGGLFNELIAYTGALDLGNAATGSGTFTSTDITVPGVALGDMVITSSIAIDTVDAAVVAAVTAANTVTVTLLNNTSGAVNLASATFRCLIGKPNDQYFYI
jgi:hypothetical protein